MVDRPRHASWHVPQNWRFGAVLTVVWVVLAWVRWSVYFCAGSTTLRLVLGLVSTALAIGYLVATAVLWRRSYLAGRAEGPATERSTGRHAR